MWILNNLEQIQWQTFLSMRMNICIPNNQKMHKRLSGYQVITFFLDFLTLEDGTDIFSGNVGK
jgi:hypothetical protein